MLRGCPGGLTGSGHAVGIIGVEGGEGAQRLLWLLAGLRMRNLLRGDGDRTGFPMRTGNGGSLRGRLWERPGGRRFRSGERLPEGWFPPPQQLAAALALVIRRRPVRCSRRIGRPRST